MPAGGRKLHEQAWERPESHPDNTQNHNSLAWWHMSVIPALGIWKHEDLEFKASLGYVSKTLSPKEKKKKFNTGCHF
jgi:hypothetical protein